MAEDETGWSEKSKGSSRDKGSTNDAAAKGSASESSESKTPSRPSTRDTSSSSGAKESSVVRTPSGDAGARKVAKAAATAGQRDVSFRSRLGFPALVALVCILGLLAVFFAWNGREALARPVENEDHWHAVYGVYDCTQPGENKYLPAFQSADDATGIHSHGDGLMHIHPFIEAASGERAQVRHFLNEMRVSVDTERIVLDDGRELVAGTECADGSGPAEIKIFRWNFDFEATAEENRPTPAVYDTELGNVRFNNDREVFIFAFAAEGAEETIPAPPAERFETLNNVSSALDYNPTQLNPQDTGTDLGTDEGTEVEPDAEEADE